MSASTSTGGSRGREIRQAFRLLRAAADRRLLGHELATVAVVIAAGALAALSPLVLKSLVDAVAAPPGRHGVGGWSSPLSCGAAYLLLLVAGRVLADIRPLLIERINHRLHSRLADQFFNHVLRLPMAYLLRRRSGELQHSLDLASAGAQLMVSLLVSSLLPVLVELVTMTTVLVHLDQPSLVVAFGVAALAYLAVFATGARAMARTARDVSTSSLDMHGQLGDSLAHFETLRYFAAEHQASLRLRAACAKLEQRWNRLSRLNAGIALSASSIFGVLMAVCLSIGVAAVAKNAMSIGGFVLTTLYALQMVRPLESLGTAAPDLARAMGYLRPLTDLLSQPLSEGSRDAMCAGPTGVAGQRRPPAVRFENVHFAYDPGKPVIKGVDLHVPAGSTMAIVGRSGSGKSSLARLLMRLYEPQQGRILLDGQAIASIAVAELRGSLVGLVPQETALLHESVAGNISLGAPAASRDDILAAARGARLEAFVDALPLGLDTPVGERGLQLSGGERQRVGIARALLRRPGLYVLDEPTSMLDSRTELEIQEALRSLAAGATMIIIAHRLSTIVHADEIVVLDEGRIRERGSHHALLAQDGLYAGMWRQQTAGVP